MKKIPILIALFASISIIQGCYYDKAELVYPINTNTCDTIGMTYTTHVQPIIQNYCYSCHAGTAPSGGGIVLDSYAGVKNFAAGGGSLIDRITSTDPSVQMPRGGPKLSDCDISKIKAWVNAGTPN